MNSVLFNNIGLIEYSEAYNIQKKIFDSIILEKQENKITSNNQIIICEHPHVFTLGKSGKNDNLLVTEQWLKFSGVSYFKTDRGGDITYHGPGQIVGYPILDLELYKLGIKDYIEKLELSIIDCLKKLGISAEIMQGATGVWLDKNTNPRKICAIGVKASRFVTMHGFALNVNTDLNYFDKIIPCGISDKKVTSISKELGYIIDNKDVVSLLKESLAAVFGWNYIE